MSPFRTFDSQLLDERIGDLSTTDGEIRFIFELPTNRENDEDILPTA